DPCLSQTRRRQALSTDDRRVLVGAHCSSSVLVVVTAVAMGVVVIVLSARAPARGYGARHVTVGAGDVASRTAVAYAAAQETLAVRTQRMVPREGDGWLRRWVERPGEMVAVMTWRQWGRGRRRRWRQTPCTRCEVAGGGSTAELSREREGELGKGGGVRGRTLGISRFPGSSLALPAPLFPSFAASYTSIKKILNLNGKYGYTGYIVAKVTMNTSDDDEIETDMLQLVVLLRSRHAQKYEEHNTA
ncbi:hypothetical protein BDN70DRAFT_901833, partial [Pholiota conissans]